jgi:hypothetical protein
MLDTKSYYPINVLTNRGKLELKDVLPGDYVFEYKTNNLLKVIGVSDPEYSNIYRISYNDGRSQLVPCNGSIYTGSNIVSMIEKDNSILEPISQYPICFNTKVSAPLDPIAYLAGAFLIYGDYNDKYLNLPFELYGINSVFSNHYSVNYESTPVSGSNSKVYFIYNHNHKIEKIQWNQIFIDKVIGATTGGISDIIIPDEYMKASIKERCKFIRGIFDMGYSPKLFSNNKVGVVNESHEKLLAVQEMLWSLGVLSEITCDIFAKKNKYILTILGEYNGYPGFTYLIDHIEYLLNADNKIINHESSFNVSINDIKSNHISGNQYQGYMSNLILEKPKALYIDGSYLPRVSL